MGNNNVVYLSDKYIELSEDDLRKMIPWFSAFIQIGREWYREDLDCDELAEKIIEWRIEKNSNE